MCTSSCLIAGVQRARLPYAENPVSGDLQSTREDVCARAVPASGVRKCGVGARREKGQRHGCGESVPDAAGGWRPLVGSPLHLSGHVRSVYRWAQGGLGDAASSSSAGSGMMFQLFIANAKGTFFGMSESSAGSGMRGRLGWCGVQWLFQGCCSGGRVRYSTTDAWRTGTLQKDS